MTFTMRYDFGDFMADGSCEKRTSLRGSQRELLFSQSLKPRRSGKATGTAERRASERSCTLRAST